MVVVVFICMENTENLFLSCSFYYRMLFFSLSNNVTVISIFKFDPIHTENHAIIVYSVVFRLYICYVLCVYVQCSIECRGKERTNRDYVYKKRRDTVKKNVMEFKCMHTHTHTHTYLYKRVCMCLWLCKPHHVVARRKSNDIHK